MAIAMQTVENKPGKLTALLVEEIARTATYPISIQSLCSELSHRK
jgi:hypothetical protein